MATTTVTASMPGVVNLDVYHGDSWSQQFKFLENNLPVNLTGLTITSSVRGTDGATANLTVTIVDAANGTIAIGHPTGGLAPDLYDYDIEITDAGAVTTWVRGRLRLYQDVTP